MGAVSKSSWKRRARIAHPGAGNTITYEIDKGGFLEDIMVVARGIVRVTGGTSNGVATADYNPQALVSKFEVIGNSAGVYPGGMLKSVLSSSVHARVAFDDKEYLGDLTGATLSGAIGNYTIKTPYQLRFALPNNPEPNETSLFTAGYVGLQLVIYCGQGTDLFPGCDRNFDFSGVTFDIYDRRNAGSPNKTEVAVLFETDQIIPIGGANDSWNLRDYLRKNEPYLDILVMAQTTNHALSDSVLLEVKTVEDEKSVPFMQGIDPDALKFRQFREVNAGQSTTGLYRIPLAEDFMLSQLISNPAITVNVANPGGANNDRLILSSRRVLRPTVAKDGSVSFA